MENIINVRRLKPLIIIPHQLLYIRNLEYIRNIIKKLKKIHYIIIYSDHRA